LQASSELVDGLLRATDLLTEAMRLHLEGEGLPFEARKSVMSELDGVLRGESARKKDSPRKPSADSSAKSPKPAQPESGKKKPESASQKDVLSTAKPAKDVSESKTATDECGPETATQSPLNEESPKPQMGFHRDMAGDTIRVKTDKLDALMAGMGELLVARMRMEQRLGELKSVQSVLGAWEKLGRKSRALKRARGTPAKWQFGTRRASRLFFRQ
jgi:chemotaxis protein histidine kinase CheA